MANAGALKEADEKAQPTTKAVCLPGARLHIQEMQVINDTITTLKNEHKVLEDNIQKITKNISKDRVSALQSFVLPTFHTRDNKSAVSVLKDFQVNAQELKKKLTR